MPRTRKISTDDILDAAERVVLNVGAAGFSIDAVAQEAGVSKSRVVYDHKSKSALLEALIERRLNVDGLQIREAVKHHAEAPDPELFGRIAVAEKVPDDTDKAVCLAIGAAMSSEERIHNRLRKWTADDLKDMGRAAKPKAALLAYLALTGFYCTELFNFHEWELEQRLEILDGIREIYTSLPENK